jgi:D-psicose/D-tagatose/L-ribulose 3-epimerase
MNLIGCHAQVWVGDVDGRSLRTAAVKTRDAGFDLIEFPVLQPACFDVDSAREALSETGLAASASLGLDDSSDISSDTPESVARGAELLHSAVRVANDLGSAYLCGVIYSAMRKYMAPVTPSGYANSVAVIRDVADHAASVGVTLGLEVVNRYESNVLNTAAQALAFLDAVGRDNVRVHLDTYHMNIEESDLAGPVLRSGGRLGYVHVGENHRGYLGSGSLGFPRLYQALATIGYSGPVVFESFSSAVVSTDLSRMLGIWREVWSDNEDLGRQAAGYMRSLAAASSAGV